MSAPLEGTTTVFVQDERIRLGFRWLDGLRERRVALSMDELFALATRRPAPPTVKARAVWVGGGGLEIALPGAGAVRAEVSLGWVVAGLSALVHSEANRRTLQRKLKAGTVNVKIDQRKTAASALRSFAGRFAKKYGGHYRMRQREVEAVLEEALRDVRAQLDGYESICLSVRFDQDFMTQVRAAVSSDCVALLETRMGAELWTLEAAAFLAMVHERYPEDGEALAGIFKEHESAEGRALIALTVVDDRVCLGLVNNRDESDVLELRYLAWLVEEPDVPRCVRAGMAGRGRDNGTPEIVAVLEPRFGCLRFFEGMVDGKSIDDTKRYRYRREYHLTFETLLLYFQLGKREELEQVRFRQMQERAERSITSAHIRALLTRGTP